MKGQVVNKMKILIVDDEQLVRIGIKTMLQVNDDGFEVVGEAGDGEKALEIAKAANPDILLVDIRMPVMNGIDFITAAKKILPHSKFIILSCINEFEYARAAMQLGVTDYIIKTTIDSDELLEILRKVKVQILEERAQLSHTLTNRKLSHINKPILYKERLNRLLNGSTLSRDELEDLLPGIGISLSDTDLRMLILRFDKAVALPPRFTAKDQCLMTFAAANICQEILERYATGYVFERNLDEVAILLKMHRDSPGEEQALLQEMCRGMIGSLDQYMGIRVSIGISEGGHSFLLLQTACSQASKALENRFFNGYGSINLFTDASQKAVSSGCETTIKSLCSELPRQVLAGSFSTAAGMTDQLAEAILRSHTMEIHEVKALFCKLMFELVQNTGHFCIDYEKHGLKYELSMNRLMESETLAELKERFKEWVGRLMDRIKESESSYSLSLITKIKEFVSENITGDIDLNTVSEFIKMNPSYLSKLFKAKTGEGFSDYVLKEKIKLSKEMLRNGEKLWVIAEKIGYSDIASLSRAFKKTEGITPKQYKLRITK